MVQGGNEDFLRGINFAALVMPGFEAKPLFALWHALEEAGAVVRVLSAEQGTIATLEQDQASPAIDVHRRFDEADPEEFAAVLIAGGKAHAEQLRRHPAAREFIQAFARDEKPVASCGHGIALLADGGVLQGQTVTSPVDLKEEVVQAGSNWTGEAVVASGWLLSTNGTENDADFVQATLTLAANHVKQSVKGQRDEKGAIGPSS